jgi:mono/diheme cytochrome c family protein
MSCATRLAAAALACALASGGCDRKDDTATTAPVATAVPTAPATTASSASASPDSKVRQIFSTRCAGCHGPSGKGDGPIAASLTPRPRDYSDAAWQKATTDEALETVIARGGAAVQKSPMMPPSPDLAADPAALAAMVKLVRSFGG